MTYQSPIEVIQTQLQNQLEGEIYTAVMNVGVNVDKEELIKALRYDRNQYQKGYTDRDEEIVRCKDCKYAEVPILNCFKNTHCYCAKYELTEPKDWYCADGERRTDDAWRED